MVLFNMSDTSELKRPFTDSTILNKLREILIEKGHSVPEGDISKFDFAQDLNLDSLDTVELVIAVESEFGIKIDNSEMQNIKNLGELVGLITRLQS